MDYIEGFVAAVPTKNKDEYIRHATTFAAIFKEYGATRVVECWGDDVPPGKKTSFPLAVQCKDDETVIFSWVTWPSQEVREAGMKGLMEDSRMKMDDMPFDGSRLIYGGFKVIVDQ